MEVGFLWCHEAPEALDTKTLEVLLYKKVRFEKTTKISKIKFGFSNFVELYEIKLNSYKEALTFLVLKLKVASI